MHAFKAFRGSKPIFENDKLLIVKSVCKDEEIDNYENLKDYIIKKLKNEGYDIIENPEEIDEFVDKINENFMKEKDITPFGFEKMKESFKIIGCECDYAIGKKNNIMVGVTIYYDKNMKKPKFIEVVGLCL